MPSIFVGTSGWLYDWNEGSSLKWYVSRSLLNAVELNASFYRFPYPSQVKSWSRQGRSLRWAIKVHRSITHFKKLKEEALSTWNKFYRLFKPMDDIIDFYLFQMPPSFKRTNENIKRVILFANTTNLNERFAIEFRHLSWFTKEVLEELGDHYITIVSVDSPQTTWIIKSANNILYLRLHGRTIWYAHDYSDSELRELALKIKELNPRKIYVFFNNNHWMLENARRFKHILEEILL